MPVTNDQVATLRALLSDDLDRYRQLLARLDQADARDGYAVLLAAAFSAAAARRFCRPYAQADIIAFVSAVRARSEHIAESLDPDVAQRMLIAVLGGASSQGLSGEARASTSQILLAELIADEHLDHAGLAAVLADARERADRLEQASIQGRARPR
jgi:hypothetical protein